MTDAGQIFEAAAISMVVADLEQSTRFYCDGLGFTEGQTGERGDESAANLELPTCKFRIRYLAGPGMRLELVEFLDPAPIGERTRKPSNRIGPHAIVFTCQDAHAAAKKLQELGGTLVLATKAGGGRFDSVTVTDPDGLRIMLLTAPLDDLRPLFGA